MSLSLTSKPKNYWPLYVAISRAKKDSREAPWYGPWNLVLQELFRDFGPMNFTTATYPQFPLVHNIDTYDSDEEKLDEEPNDHESLYSLSLINLLPTY